MSGIGSVGLNAKSALGSTAGNGLPGRPSREKRHFASLTGHTLCALFGRTRLKSVPSLGAVNPIARIALQSHASLQSRRCPPSHQPVAADEEAEHDAVPGRT